MKRGPYKDREKEYGRARELRVRGWTLSEISDEIGVPTKTVHRWVHDIEFDRSEVQKRGNPTAPLSELRCKKAIRRRLIAKNGRACEWCGRSEWNGLPTPLELHTGGDRPEVLCPNCHALTPDWKTH